MIKKHLIPLIVIGALVVAACTPAAAPTTAPAAPTTAPAAPAETTVASPAETAAAKPAEPQTGAAELPSATSQVADATSWADLENAYPRPEKPSKNYTIGVSIANVASGGTHFAAQLYGYLDEAEQLGAKVIWHDAGGYANVAKQIDHLEDLVANKVDAIIIVATNGPGTKAAVHEIVNTHKIPVINVNVMTDSDAVTSRIRSDDEVLGKLQGEFLKKQVGDKETNVVMMPGSPGTSWAVGRAKGFRDAVQDSPNIKILAEQYVENTVPNGLKLAEDYLQTFPNINAVMCGSDTQCIGMAQALQAANKQDVILTTSDFQPDGQKMIEAGRVTYASIQAPTVMGRWGIRAAINALEGREVPKTLFTPIGEVTKENASKIQLPLTRAPEDWKP